MGRNIRFPLKMANGAEVRDLDEFTANFDLESALGYYEDGKLLKWLKDHYYDTEADKLEALDKTAKSFTSDFCAVFGIEMPEDDGNSGADIDYIARRNEKKRILRTITDDESVIYNVDSVALNQDNLLDIFDEGKKEIYLCRGEFEIPLSVTGVTYHGIADPVITVRVTDNVNFNERNIRFVDCVYGWDVSKTSPLDNMKRAEHLFLKGDYQKSAGILETYAEQGNPRAVMLLCHIYKELLPDNDKLKKWSERAKQSCEVCNVIDNIESGAEKYFALVKRLADKGDAFYEYYYARALHLYGKLHYSKNDIETMIEFYRSYAKEMIKFYTRSAEKGNVVAMCCLGECYNGKDDVYAENSVKSFEWYSKGAEYGDAEAQYMLTQVVNDLGDEDDIEIDIDKILAMCKEAAEKGYAKAQYMLGDAYSAGNFGDEDYEKAVEWYTKAAEQGYVEAQIELAEMYKDGYDIEEDMDLAVKWYTKVAESDDPEKSADAMWELGNIYDGVEQYNTAFQWYKRSFEHGCDKPRYQLVHYYATGCGVEQNYDKAFSYMHTGERFADLPYEFIEFLEEGANNGDSNKQYILGIIYWYGLHGIPEDKDISLQWLTKAAENGLAEASEPLGFYCHRNIKDESIFEKVKYLLTKSFENGNTDAILSLGTAYQSRGDDEQAVKYYIKARRFFDNVYQYYSDQNRIYQLVELCTKGTEDGDKDFAYWLGSIYEKENNIEKAVECYTKAFEAGHTKVAFKLGQLYEAENNIEKAIMWYTKAEDLWHIRNMLLASDETVTN